MEAGQFRMLMAGLHTHESSQVTVEKLKWKKSHTSETFKITILLRRWQDCLDCRPKSPDFIHAMLSLSQLRSGDELECFQPLHVSGFFFSAGGGSGGYFFLSLFLSFSLSFFPPPFLPPFLPLFLSSCLSFLSVSLFGQQFL